MKIQELTQNGRPRKIPPIEVTSEQWERMKKTVVGRKRFKVVRETKKKGEIDKLK